MRCGRGLGKKKSSGHRGPERKEVRGDDAITRSSHDDIVLRCRVRSSFSSRLRARRGAVTSGSFRGRYWGHVRDWSTHRLVPRHAESVTQYQSNGTFAHCHRFHFFVLSLAAAPCVGATKPPERNAEFIPHAEFSMSDLRLNVNQPSTKKSRMLQ